MNEIQPPLVSVGVVVIARNEGERLRKCIESVLGKAGQVVYVDSGSTDGSVNMAQSLGVEVVNLDMNLPFTAARARNEGFKHLRELATGIIYVQFVDGDCEVVRGWLEKSLLFLETNPAVAVVCGRRRERYPERSVYNMLCDIEWDTPVGEAKSCGGDALMRADALAQVGGYREDLIAGEEPELCVRLRETGWKIWRLGEEMTLHDASITRIAQWWKRTKRSGYAYAEGRFLHGAPPERYGTRESLSTWMWGLGVPVVTAGFILCFGLWGMLLLLLISAQIIRLALRGKRSFRENWWYATFLVLGKFPEATGQLRFLYNRLLGRTARIIEYK
jgi:GT2 family glycosyltransferase